MTAAALIEELTHLGVKLVPEGDRLRYRGPATVITPELKQRIVEQKAEIIATLAQARRENYGAGRPSPENAARPIEDRRRESLELRGELTEFYNRLASTFEDEGRFPRAEAERLAMIETRETELYRRWLALG
jgi:hypothetical protein